MSENRQVDPLGCGRGKGIDLKETQKNLGDDRNVLYLDHHGSYITVYLCQNSSNYILYNDEFYCM